MKLYPLHHFGCGGLVIYALKPLNVGDELNAENFIRLDGSHPIDMIDIAAEKCQKCGEMIEFGKWGPFVCYFGEPIVFIEDVQKIPPKALDICGKMW